MSCEKGISMNLAYFLLPKTRVAYLYDDFTFRQGLEKMRCHGYTAIPAADSTLEPSVREISSGGFWMKETGNGK